MVSTRRTARNSSTEQKTNDDQWPSSRVRKPLPEPPSILHVMTLVVMHLCKKVVFFSIHVRIFAYITLLFALSSITDVLPMPKMPFSNANRFVNAYFVKLGWFWTLLLSVPFVFMTSYTYCCGKKGMIAKHLFRLLVATAFWYFWVNLFVYIEGLYGLCSDRPEMKTKSACLRSASKWMGFDLSGHTFILIYSNLVLIEEMRPILGWEGIADLIRDESHGRDHNIANYGPLRGLSMSDFDATKTQYRRFLPWVRLNFVLVTLVSITWDVMLISTIIYFHAMPEKLISGFIAIGTWYVTYRICYERQKISPGDGSFQYFSKEETEMVYKQPSRRNSLNVN